MLTENITVQLRGGRVRSGSVMLPETLDESIILMDGVAEILKVLHAELMRRAKKKLKARPPKKTLLVKLDQLTPEQRAKLIELKLIT